MSADRSIYPADAAERLRHLAGQLYRPSNGSEGDYFESRWCAECRRRGGEGDACRIILAAMAFSPRDAEYPPEWIYGEDGQPQCSAFQDKHAPRPAYRCKTTVDLFAASPSLTSKEG